MSSIRIAKHYIHAPYLLLGVVEALVFVGAVFVGSFLRFGEPVVVDEDLAPLPLRALFFSFVLLVSMLAMGVYQVRYREGYAGMLLRTATSFMLSGVALSLLFYVVPPLFLGRGILAFSILIALAAIALIRLVFFRNLSDDLLKTRVLVLGAGQRAVNILERLRRRADRKGFSLQGFVPVEREAVRVPEKTLLQPEGSLLDYALSEEVDEIVWAVDDRRSSGEMDDLFECKMAGIAVIDVATFFEREVGRMELDLIHPSALIFSDGFNRSPLRSFSKRAFDLCAASTLLLLSLPVLVLTRICIGLEEGFRAPVIYRQTRVGLDDKPFTVSKFRSMRVDAEREGAQFAQQGDSRVTRVGQVIRKYRIDELPQLLNILKGDMSFVGPRPERPEFVQGFEARIPFYNARHRVKPGLTGWAQINYPYGDSEEDARLKLQYDLYYVKNHSLMLDLLILIRTVETILFQQGSR